MENIQHRELFDTGVKKIRHEIRSLLAQHGLFGTISDLDNGPPGSVPESTRVEIQVKGRVVGRQFDRHEIEGCCLRVKGAVLSSITAMVDEASASG
jgi:hypothetical protein